MRVTESVIHRHESDYPWELDPDDAVHGARNRGPASCTIVWVFPADSYDEIEYFPAGEGRPTPD